MITHELDLYFCMKEEKDIINADVEADIDNLPIKKSNSKIMVIIISILMVIIAIILAFTLSNNHKDTVSTNSTTKISSWDEDENIDTEKQTEKYPDHSLPPLTVD